MRRSTQIRRCDSSDPAATWGDPPYGIHFDTALAAGILPIGFSGSRWTKFFTERYLSAVASVGVKLFVLYLSWASA